MESRLALTHPEILAHVVSLLRPDRGKMPRQLLMVYYSREALPTEVLLSIARLDPRFQRETSAPVTTMPLACV